MSHMANLDLLSWGPVHVDQLPFAHHQRISELAPAQNVEEYKGALTRRSVNSYENGMTPQAEYTCEWWAGKQWCGRG